MLLSAFFLIIIGRDITRSNRYRRELEEARRRAEEDVYKRQGMPMMADAGSFSSLSSLIVMNLPCASRVARRTIFFI